MKRWGVNNLGLYAPTDKEMEINRYYLSECERLGINVYTFNDAGDTMLTKDELRAISILIVGGKLPCKLEQKLLETKEERMSRWGKYEPHELVFTPEDEAEFNRLYG